MKKLSKSFDQIIAEISAQESRIAEKQYLMFHYPRYKYLIQEIEKIVETPGQKPLTSMLDIGPACQTYLIRELFDLRVNTLGINSRFNQLQPGRATFYNRLE